MSEITLVAGVFIACSIIFVKCDTSFSKDSYLNAYEKSHQIEADKNNADGYNYSPPVDNYYYLPPSTTPVYGPPASIFGTPAPVYGSPLAFYKPIHHPRDHWFLEKLKTKVNLFTIGKILLKLLIFKKIVKFIGIICLLLFLPKLKDMFKDNMSMEEDDMESKHVEIDKELLEKRIEELYDFIVNAISTYPSESAESD